MRRAAKTPFGRTHGFLDVQTVGQFQQRVPLCRYEDLWRDWWEPHFPVLQDVTWPGRIPYIAASSGTTAGVTKYIPVSPAMMASNRRATLDLLTHHLRNRPRSRMLGGKNLVLGGSSDLTELAPGVLAGDLTGIAAQEIPLWARPYYYPPRELALIADWEHKMEILGPRSLEQDIRTIGGTASWLILFLERLVERHGRPEAGLASVYPNLELVVHGGVDFAPYRERFERLLHGSHAELREVYPASEGFVAVADRGTGEGLRLLADNGVFFEFVPVEDLHKPDPRRHWVADVEPDVNYAVIVSTCAGLWGYILGDTVRFLSRRPPRLVITGRTSYSLSAFGEHVIGEEIERAVAAAAHAIGRTITDYSVGPLFPGTDGSVRGGHLYIVEFVEGVPPDEDTRLFAQTVDETLSRLNADYETHRVPGVGMDVPRVAAVQPGTFAAWMKRRGRLGGQNKVPRVINDPKLFGDLRRFAGGGRPILGASG